MSATDVVVAALLVVGVAAQLTGVVGVLAARNVYDRLHFTGPASIFGPLALAAAIVLDEGPVSQAGLKSMLVALLVLSLNPILVHASGRAAFVREHGRITPVSEVAKEARR
ncbi:MAG TPA: monovalent cation/H(+) antiporter subunit G [Solirubrobacteraceae bacterium]